MTRFISNLLACCLIAGLMSGCLRGRPKTKPPIHPNPNMDNQPKYIAQQEGKFFANNSAMRVPPAGTVARGWLGVDAESVELKDGTVLRREAVVIYYSGKDKAGVPAPSPVPLTACVSDAAVDSLNWSPPAVEVKLPRSSIWRAVSTTEWRTA